jgi:hypothetical protein
MVVDMIICSCFVLRITMLAALVQYEVIGAKVVTVKTQVYVHEAAYTPLNEE